MENIFSTKVVLVLLGLGVLCILGPILVHRVAPNEAVMFAGIGCFLSICSRIVQAEVHQTENKKIWIAGTRERTNPND